MQSPPPVPPPASLADASEPAPKLIHGGLSPVWRGERGVLRAAPARVIEAQLAGVSRLQEQFPALASHAPRPLRAPVEHAGLTWLLEEDLGPPSDTPLETLAQWAEHFGTARSEREPLDGSLRELLRRIEPAGLPRPPRLVSALRAARKAGAPLPFAPRLATLQRALDRPLTLELTRGWAHGALQPGRVLAGGACHWRRFGPDHWHGVDQAPFVTPSPDDPAGALLALAWGWRHDPERAAEALVALGLIDPAPPAVVELGLAEPHPCLGPDALEQLLGVALGEVTAGQAAQALGRGDGLVVAGSPLRLSCTPAVRPRRPSATWRIRGRDPTRLFSRWHQGVRLDPDARASLTPEKAALATAHRLRAATVLDAFCGAGGNAIAFARMPWCEGVVAVERDPERLAMARHNAALYGVQDRIEFVLGDALALMPSLEHRVDACFLDPPWDAGSDFAERAWTAARGRFERGAMKQPRQWAPPPGASALEAVFGVGWIVSWVQAWWGPVEDRTER